MVSTRRTRPCDSKVTILVQIKFEIVNLGIAKAVVESEFSYKKCCDDETGKEIYQAFI